MTHDNSTKATAEFTQKFIWEKHEHGLNLSYTAAKNTANLKVVNPYYSKDENVEQYNVTNEHPTTKQWKINRPMFICNIITSTISNWMLIRKQNKMISSKINV